MLKKAIAIIITLSTFFALHVPGAKMKHYDSSYDLTDEDTSKEEVTPPKKSYFRFDLDMANNFSYKDTKDSVSNPFLNPSCTYKAKSGFFASVGAYRVSNTNLASPWVEVDLGSGWNFDVSENGSAGLSYSYSIYNRKFNILQTALSNDLSGFYEYDFSFIDARLSCDYSFGRVGGDSVVTEKKAPAKPAKGGKAPQARKTVQKATFLTSHDFFTTLSFSHEFTWEKVFSKKDEISFEPGLYISMGTNNFYNDLYKKKIAERNKFKKGQIGKVETNSEADTISTSFDASAAAFKVREYIFSIPIGYSYGNFSITPEFEYIIPVNQPDDPELKMNPYSLFKIGLSYKLK